MWKPDSLSPDTPLYIGIADALARDISSGRLRPGERLPTQRALASTIGVDLSTVTRALRECERRGLVAGTVGRGTFVSADIGISVPLARTDDASDLLEMGLVLPLYAAEEAVFSAVRKAMAAVDLSRFLRYADPAGMPEHRAAGAAWLSRAGVKVPPSRVLVTSGSQNAIACCLMSLFSPGDRVAVDSLTFPGLKTAAQMLNVRLVPIRMDEGGMVPAELAATCLRERIRGLYLMPEVQNPTTSSLSEERRERIARIVLRNDLILMEDDAFGHTGARRGAALSARLPENGIFLGGTSKVFGAGLRVSFVAAPTRFIAPLERAILSTVWMASPLTTEILIRVIASGKAEALIRAKNREATKRTSLALKKLSAWRVHSRPSGFYVWLELPQPWTGRELELAAREAGVRVFCAEKFAVGGAAVPSAVRLSLTGPETLADLSRGLDLMAGILRTGPRDPGAIL
jgi:DNA-binding transcriptional MocR family regulator